MSKEKTVKIIPRGLQVLVRPDEDAPRESEYGIVLPSNVDQESKAIGTVKAVGPKVEDIKEGDRVVYGAFAGEKISFKESKKEVDYVLLFEEDVLAFIEE